MLFKTIFIFLFFINVTFASFQKVKIGKIDDYYSDKITLTQVENIVKEIEQTFETQLNFNVFDVSYDGKPIDILYLEPSTLEKRLNRKVKNFEEKSEKVSNLKEFFPKKKLKLILYKSNIT